MSKTLKDHVDHGSNMELKLCLNDWFSAEKSCYKTLLNNLTWNKAKQVKLRIQRRQIVI